MPDLGGTICGVTAKHLALACYLLAFGIQISATYAVFKSSRTARRAAATPILTDHSDGSFTINTDGVEMFIRSQAVPVWYLAVLVLSALIDLAGNWLTL
jgi:hypothetical protein